MLNLRVQDGGPLVFAACWKLQVEGESRVGSDEVVASLRSAYLPPPPPSPRPWGGTRAQRYAPWIRVAPGADGQSVRIRHRIEGVQRGAAAFLFKGTLAEGVRPRLTGTITLDLQAGVVAFVSLVFAVVATIGLPVLVVSTATAAEPDWGVVVFMSAWFLFAFAGAWMAWRALAKSCRQLVATLETALGDWPLSVAAGDPPWRSRTSRRARRSFN